VQWFSTNLIPSGSVHLSHKQQNKDTSHQQQDEQSNQAVSGIRIVGHEESHQSCCNANHSDAEYRGYNELGVTQLLDLDIESLGSKKKSHQ